MPALPSVPNVVRVDWLWDDGSDNNVSTRNYFRYSGSAPTSADCVTLAADIYADMSAHDDLWSAATVLTGTRVIDLSSPSGGVGEHAQSTPGTIAFNELPGGVAMLVNYVIGRRYRGGKPRSYFPFGSSEQIFTRQQWQAAFVTAVDSGLAAYFSAVIGTTVGGTTLTEHVNISYYEGFTVVTNPVTHRARNVPTVRAVPVVDNILSFAASSRPASQRRRN